MYCGLTGKFILLSQQGGSDSTFYLHLHQTLKIKINDINIWLTTTVLHVRKSHPSWTLCPSLWGWSFSAAAQLNNLLTTAPPHPPLLSSIGPWTQLPLLRSGHLLNLLEISRRGSWMRFTGCPAALHQCGRFFSLSDVVSHVLCLYFRCSSLRMKKHHHKALKSSSGATL